VSLVAIAKKDLGQKEKENNSGFEDQQLEIEMKAVGWKKGYPWCSLIVKRWALKAFPDRKSEFEKLFSPSAVTTFENFKNAGYSISLLPVAGAIVIWQRYVDGNPTWKGHAGIVSEVLSKSKFKSIEGNGSVKGSPEGTTVVEPLRKIATVQTGLNVLGFIILSNDN
jgi:hypothetical protein